MSLSSDTDDKSKDASELSDDGKTQTTDADNGEMEDPSISETEQLTDEETEQLADESAENPAVEETEQLSDDGKTKKRAKRAVAFEDPGWHRHFDFLVMEIWLWIRSRIQECFWVTLP